MSYYARLPAFPWLAAVIPMMIWSSPALAQISGPAFGLSGGLESFNLRELSSTGTRLLSESGNRYVISAALDNKDRYNLDVPLLYHLEAALYTGEVNYNGQSQSGVPAQNNLPFDSTTDYQGGRAEAMLGYRFWSAMLPRPLEILGGLGLDGWSRRIKAGSTAGGVQVSGIHEEYSAYYGKLALGMTDLIPGTWHNHLQLGIKMPFSINEDVSLRAVGYDNDVSLSPGNAYTGYFKLVIESQPAPGKSGNVMAAIYYDGFHFDPSPSKLVGYKGTINQVWQPETQIGILGVQIGYRF